MSKSIIIEGNIISQDILAKIESGDAFGQLPVDFGFDRDIKIKEQIGFAWVDAKDQWKIFQRKLERLKEKDYGTTETRNDWMLPFLRLLGYEIGTGKAEIVNGKSYAISNRAVNLDSFPVHIMSVNDSLKKKRDDGGPRMSPHGLVQEYINVTEHLFGIVSNGNTLRLIRDSGRLVKLSYIEFDLRMMMEEDQYAEFAILYRLLHASRMPRTQTDAPQSIIERYHQDAIDSGNRIRERLSDAVKVSLTALGNGFLQHPANDELRKAIADNKLSPRQYYRNLLRLVYRFLFLMVTEERDLIYPKDQATDAIKRFKEIYRRFYSINRLRKFSENPYMAGTGHHDLWMALLSTFKLFEHDVEGHKLGINALNGELFSERALGLLNESKITNELLLQCVRNLNVFEDDNKEIIRINYGSLDVEELGSVYEGLLELQPVITDINFSFLKGTDKKTTGSYYTRPDLVHELIKSALIPVIEQRLDAARKKQVHKKEDLENVLLSLKVCDTAAGSGHILLAAARTIAWYLARIRTGEDNPAPEDYRACVRDVIQHCIYAVDKNPDAVELCRLALWIEGHNSGKPLTFLEHKIKCGDSLVGVSDLKVLKEGIPDDAFNPVTGDEREVCQAFKKANKKYIASKQGTLDFVGTKDTADEQKQFADEYHQLEEIHQDTTEDIRKLSEHYSKLRNNPKWWKDWRACNLWTAAFFYNYKTIEDPAAPTSERLHNFLNNPSGVDARMVGKAMTLAKELNFFHWHLEFPDVFAQGGFDVMMGNPPWERIKLQEQEYFATRDIEIANAPNKAGREKLIKKLPETNPELYSSFQKALHDADSQSKFLRHSERFILTARGDINTYSIFAELFFTLINPSGITSIIVPTGIATDSTTSVFFSHLMENKILKSLYDFVNEKMIFPTVLHNFHFSIITITGSKIKTEKSDFAFNNQSISDLTQEQRHFTLSIEDIEKLNPESKTLPVLTSNKDSSILLKVHEKLPILAATGELNNFIWDIDFIRLFDMSGDSKLFEANAKNSLLKLYEAKMIYLYDHRYGSYDAATDERLHMLPKSELHEYIDSNYTVSSSYYVNKDEVKNRISKKWDKNWFLVFRGISSGALERTFIATIIPFSAVSNSAIIVADKNKDSLLMASLLTVFNSIIFDYITKQKAAGANLNFFKVRQLPVPSPSHFKSIEIAFLIPKVIELIYSSWDIKSFADDVWKDSDGGLKAAIKKQWEENKVITGGHEWNPPQWCDIDKEGIKLAPFKWDEERRAKLKADLDAYYAKLYGLSEEELRYILDPKDVYGEDFPGETFRVLKDKEIRKFGEYRTKKLVLDAWKTLSNQTIQIDKKLITNLDPMIEFNVHHGIYSINDVIRITKLSRDKVSRWFKELVKESYEGLQVDQQQDITNWHISFLGLIELVVVGTLRDAGVPLKNIMIARKDLEKLTGKIYPFATEAIKTKMHVSGKQITFDIEQGIITLDGTGQFNLDFVKEFFAHIIFDNSGLANHILPVKGSTTIVIDPSQEGGKPCINKKGVMVDTIKMFYQGVESIPSLIQNHNVTEDEIKAAIEYSETA